MRVTLHSGRNSQLRSPLGTAPPPQLPQKSCPVSSKYSPGLQGTTQPKITGHISTFICIPEQAQTLQQQLLDHSQAQIEFWKVAIVGTPPFPSSDTSTDGARLGWECHARCGWQNCPLAVLQPHTNIQVKEKDNVIYTKENNSSSCTQAFVLWVNQRHLKAYVQRYIYITTYSLIHFVFIHLFINHGLLKKTQYRQSWEPEEWEREAISCWRHYRQLV